MNADTIPETPCLVPVRVVCPVCSQALQVEMEVTSQLTVTTDDDGRTQVLKPKVKVQRIGHQCNQLTIDSLTGEVVA